MEASSSSSGARPTAWIVIAVICALAAIGLGIWAFTTKSDLDDANATIAKQKKELASSQQARRVSWSPCPAPCRASPRTGQEKW